MMCCVEAIAARTAATLPNVSWLRLPTARSLPLKKESGTFLMGSSQQRYFVHERQTTSVPITTTHRVKSNSAHVNWPG
jgi:hypothetical protein